MKFYDSKTAELMAELKKHAHGNMDVVERAMVKALREERIRGGTEVSVEQIKKCIDAMLAPTQEKIPA